MAKFSNMPGAMKGMGTFSKIKEDAAFHGSKRQPSKAPPPKASSKIKDTSPMSQPKINAVGGFRRLGGSSGGRRFFGN